jgi:crossover junction endodeoxyribonuclease RuvC
MNILSIDPATKCGWAHSGGMGGTWDLSVRRDESSGMRLLRLRGKLNEVKNAVGIDLLTFEAARNAAPKMQGALVIQAQFQAIIVEFCEDHNIQYRGYSPSEVKKHATGKGNASKDQMIDAAKRKWPTVPIEDDNHADALHILDLTKSAL